MVEEMYKGDSTIFFLLQTIEEEKNGKKDYAESKSVRKQISHKQNYFT